MIAPLEFFGGSTNISITANLTIDPRYRIWRISSDAGRTVSLPDIVIPGLAVGSPVFYVVNTGSNTFTISGTGFSNFSVLVNKAVIVVSVLLANGALRWSIDPRNFTTS